MREASARTWHYVKPNETTRLPRRYVFLDTEARMRRVAVGAEQTWRLGVACYVVREKNAAPRERWADYTSPGKLWEDVSDHCRKDTRTILWAHNLGYDARISGVFEHMPRLGWRLAAHNITAKGTWLEWRRDGATLVMADSTTVFAQKLARLGQWFGVGKLSVDMHEEDDAVWLARCRRDVEILKTAMLSYLE